MSVLAKRWKGRRAEGSFSRPSNRTANKSPRIVVALPAELFALVTADAVRRGVSSSRVLREMCAGHYVGRGDLSVIEGGGR